MTSAFDKRMEKKEIDLQQWKQQRSHINTRWGQLYELQKEWGKEAIKYLMLMNAGGAIATLSFIGTSKEVRELCGPKISLMLFFMGIVSAGFMIAYAFHTCNHLFKMWQQEVATHDRGEINYDQLIANDDARVPSGKVDIILGYISFGCFILGTSIGVWGLF